MSRPLFRQRPPADDDLQPVAEEELHKQRQAAAGTTKQPPTSLVANRPGHGEAAPQGGGLHTADRGAYFSGQYAPAASPSADAGLPSPELIVDRRLAEFNLPASLRHCVLDLIHMLRDHGLSAALAALHNDAAIDRRHEDQVRRLLTAIDRDDRKARA
jgi:hypothetical protein